MADCLQLIFWNAFLLKIGIFETDGLDSCRMYASPSNYTNYKV